MGLERGPLSLVSTTEELLKINSSGSGLESREYGRRDPCADHATPLYPQKLTSGGRSISSVCFRTKVTELIKEGDSRAP
jgi:hypothetical protein